MKEDVLKSEEQQIFVKVWIVIQNVFYAKVTTVMKQMTCTLLDF